MNNRTIITVLLISGVALVFDQFVNNYLLFHVIAEFFSVSIAITLFTITWNLRRQITNKYLLFVGLGGLFIGILDLLHTITYKGMNIIPSDIYYANQFWVATRMFESLIILAGVVLISKNINFRVNQILTGYSLITTAIILSILVFEVFPICFIENVGQTPFKIYSEYVIIGILIIAFGFMLKNRGFFEKDIHQLLLFSIAFAIFSEFCFTLYAQNYDFVNQVGHIFKILSFYMIFKANIQNGLSKPMETFFIDRKMHEEKIKQYNLELEREITTKNRLFSIMAHDLRNPFTVLMGYTDLLLDTGNNFSEEDKRNIVQTINETSIETYKLLENLLTWARTQTSNIAFNPVEFDISEVLDECISLVSKQAQLKNINIVSKYSPADVMADKDMIMTVVRNLLSNAVKFTPREGKIIINSTFEKNHVRILITDTGVGIPEEKLESLFQVNINSSTQGTEKEKGVGLGLIIANEFIKINKGEIRVESMLNQGSTFSFSLPAVNRNTSLQ